MCSSVIFVLKKTNPTFELNVNLCKTEGAIEQARFVFHNMILMDLKLLEKFFKKQCSPEEAKIVLECLRQEDLNPAILREMQLLWNSYEEKCIPPDYDSRKLLKDIHSKIIVKKEGYLKINRKKPNDLLSRMLNPHYILKTSAFLLLLFIIIFYAWYFYKSKTD